MVRRLALNIVHLLVLAGRATSLLAHSDWMAMVDARSVRRRLLFLQVSDAV
jgi:hypothetical protein